jgi:hypothetical protein
LRESRGKKKEATRACERKAQDIKKSTRAREEEWVPLILRRLPRRHRTTREESSNSSSGSGFVEIVIALDVVVSR